MLVLLRMMLQLYATTHKHHTSDLNKYANISDSTVMLLKRNGANTLVISLQRALVLSSDEVCLSYAPYHNCYLPLCSKSPKLRSCARYRGSFYDAAHKEDNKFVMSFSSCIKQINIWSTKTWGEFLYFPVHSVGNMELYVHEFTHFMFTWLLNNLLQGPVSPTFG